MRWQQLPPVGNKVLLSSSSSDLSKIRRLFSPKEIRFYQSGTAALASAMMIAKQYADKLQPEVLIPAYACPDLVSAANYAGLTPVLHDFEKNTPWYDINSIENKINNKTVAIVAVNFLGINERLPELSQLARKHNITLIEDSAQAFPTTHISSAWIGDLAITSFGRGKPISMLGGGLLIVSNEKYHSFVSEQTFSYGNESQLLSKIKTRIFNQILNPVLYNLIASLPFLDIGETQYKELETIENMSLFIREHLFENISAYQKRDQTIVRDIYQFAFSQLDQKGIIDLPVKCQQPNNLYLRYPILVTDPNDRKDLFQELDRKGLGCSLMYKKSLPLISGVEQQFSEQQNNPVADCFANQLITLPIHPSVTTENAKTIVSIIQKYIKKA